MTIIPLSPTAITAYQDLRRFLLDDAIGEILGRPIKRVINKRSYWYDQYRIGTAVKERYIGEDSEALQDRIADHRNLRESLERRRMERVRLIRLLRAEGMVPVQRDTGSLLRAFAKARLFQLGGVLVGTQAFRLYEGELGARILTDGAALTQDFDIAGFERLALSIGDQVEPAPAKILKQFQFEAVPELQRESVWRWKQTTGGTMVEFLTPSFEEEEGIRPLKSLNVHACALHHLNYLIAEPIQAVALYREGILVRIPRPERYAIHKLIVAARRQAGPDSLKSRKDRAQAQFLIHVLAEDRPYELKDAYDTARDMGPRWCERMDASLARLPGVGDVLAGLG